MLDVVAAVLTIAAIAVLATGGIRLGRWTVTRERYDEIGRAGSWVVLARKS
jgi:hypothetical protein